MVHPVARTPSPIPEDSFSQKFLCTVPLIGELFSQATQLSLTRKIARTHDPDQLREFQRVQTHYAIADSFRYLIYGILFLEGLKWLRQ